MKIDLEVFYVEEHHHLCTRPNEMNFQEILDELECGPILRMDHSEDSITVWYRPPNNPVCKWDCQFHFVKKNVLNINGNRFELTPFEVRNE